MKNHLFLAGQMIVFLFLCASCSSLHTYHFGVQNRAAMVPDDFGETEVAIAHAEQSQGAQYCPDKIAKAKELARQGAEVYWACHNTESSRLLAEARKLAGEAEGCGPAAATAPMAPVTPLVATPAAEPTPERMKYCVSLNIEFDINKSDIRPQYNDEVAKVGDFMKKYPTTTAVIEGYTDQVGSDDYNMKLSQQRAESVVKSLEDNFGIDPSRLSAKGYGKASPTADNSTEAGKQKNRRINAIIDCAVDVKALEVPPERLCMTLKVEFATDSAEIRPRYFDEVDKVGEYMNKYPTTTAVIEGHTDNLGGSEHNMKLSQRRAESVVNYLAGKFGIDRSRLSAKGYGSTRAIAYNNTAEGRQQNRRINAIIDCVVEK
jgi:OmpA-OmpF porin, OOP family